MYYGYGQQLFCFVFYGRLMSYCPHFWGSMAISWSIIPLTCLREMTRKSSFSRFMAVLMSYCPLFWGSRAIYNDLKNRYMFESYDKKLVVFVFFGLFHELFPTVFAFQADLQGL